jgi:YVTN family beta-propeller protein
MNSAYDEAPGKGLSGPDSPEGAGWAARRCRYPVLCLVKHGLSNPRMELDSIGAVVSDDGKRAFITNIVDNTVSVIDIATQKVIKNIEVVEGPNGITFSGANR